MILGRIGVAHARPTSLNLGNYRLRSPSAEKISQHFESIPSCSHPKTIIQDIRLYRPYNRNRARPAHHGQLRRIFCGSDGAASITALCYGSPIRYLSVFTELRKSRTETSSCKMNYPGAKSSLFEKSPFRLLAWTERRTGRQRSLICGGQDVSGHRIPQRW